MTVLNLNKRYLIIGAGKTGQSVARYLRRHGATFALLDSRPTPPVLDPKTFAGIDVFSGSFSACNLNDFDVLVVSPGVSVLTPEIVAAQREGAEVIGDIELFARDVNQRNPAPHVLAVTGSNGKSTVVSMLGAVLMAANANAAVGGNLGTPALDLLDSHADANIYVLELSSFQLETTQTLRPTAATVLNVSEDHMDRYADLEAYAEAKQRIYHNTACCVFNAADPLTRPVGKRAVSFASSEEYGADFYVATSDVMHADEPLLATAALRVPGIHNAANAAATIALLSALPQEKQISIEHIREGLTAFGGLPHRGEWIAEKDGVDWINDSKGTNVGATLTAIKGMSKPVVLIAGGDGKGADFSPLASTHPYLRAAVLIGRDGHLIAQQLQDNVDVFDARDMHAAVLQAEQLAQPGDCVLLSPACASFDMYPSYEARGEDFVTVVREVLA